MMEPTAREIMSVKEFDAMMEKGLAEAKEDKSLLAADVFADFRQEQKFESSFQTTY